MFINLIIFLFCLTGFSITQQLLDSIAAFKKHKAKKIMLGGKMVYKFELADYYIYADLMFPFYMLLREKNVVLIQNPATQQYSLVPGNKKQAIPLLKVEKIKDKT